MSSLELVSSCSLFYYYYYYYNYYYYYYYIKAIQNKTSLIFNNSMFLNGSSGKIKIVCQYSNFTDTKYKWYLTFNLNQII
ncbi:hypothetical protein BpHYR1_010103 [Brachionus plicatilis]|uniref:Uncharacterized protein n=1 Tax=Brachionus plicatilis TaxID=10195 RepID=A0A3M7S710_BRAPC|nr:hypothetical protein BpHYR1_010103 [Brachionus plicatilis]